jgi:endonuclease/exonuclease/phosphatase family metal-dependent hydrolase
MRNRFRIVTWNMNQQGSAAWEFLLGTLDPDIALLQEAVLPGEPLAYSRLWTSGWEGGRWGSALLSRVGDLSLQWEDSSRGAVLAAHCESPALGSVSLVCIHARIIDGRVIPALRQTFDNVRQHISDRFVVGGDLNTARAAAAAWPAYGHGEFWRELEATGFVEPLPLGSERQSYWREWRRNKPPTRGNSLQDDHVLLDEETSKHVIRCRVWDTRQVRELSDHGPIVVDLALPQ